jgi:hypothetical protein
MADFNDSKPHTIRAGGFSARRIISAFAKAVRSLESVKKTPCRLLIRTPALALQNGFWDPSRSESKKRESIPIISTVS